MGKPELIISPKTKIGELLEAYPQLEETLIRMSPVFAKLKNPVLRKTVARVATIQQISVVGGIPVDEIIKKLREETGQDSADTIIVDEYAETAPPEWFDENKIVQKYDASPVINAGESPMAEVLRESQALHAGEIFELQTPFIPAPIIDMLKNKGFQVYSVQKENIFLNYIMRK